MDLSNLKTHASRAFAALFALTVCSGIAQATNVLVVTGTPTLTCNTSTGAGAAGTFTVKPVATLTASSPAIVVTVLSTATGVTVTPPALTSLTSTNAVAGLVYSVNISAPGCVGLTAGSALTLVTFKAGAVTDATGTGTISPVVTTTSGLGVGTTFTVTCIKTVITAGPTTYAPGPAVTVPVSSTSSLGTPFTVDNSTAAPPAWLSVTPLAGGTPTTTTPVNLSIVAAASCGGQTSAPSAGAVTLNNLPGGIKTFAVNMTFTTVTLAASPLTPLPSPASLTYVKGSGSPGHVDVNIGSSTVPAPFFTVDLTTLPNWLSVDSSNGTAGKTVRFSSTTICDSLAPGTYTAAVGLKVSGVATYLESISLLITNSAPKLTISGGLSQTFTWAVGSNLPTASITAVSSDSPIPYTVTTGGQLQPAVSTTQQTGLAYSFGTPIAVSFSPLQFAAAQPGSSLSGTVSLTWGSPAVTTVVTLTYMITAPGSSATGITPASLPTSSTVGQQFPVTLLGTGFVLSTDPAQKTKVGIVTGSGSTLALTSDPNITWTIVDASHITLNVTVPASSSSSPLTALFSPSGAGGFVTLGVCNPNGTVCSVPTNATAVLSIGANPIIQAVSSASTFAQVTAPNVQTIAPYDMLSIFGSNFCSQYAATGSQGCSSTTVLSGAPSALTLTYPTSVSPDLPLTATSRLLTVGFWAHGATATPLNVIAYAPILFATNGQINILAPSVLVAGTSYDLYVNFGYLTGVKSSQAYTVNVIAANPGIFTVGADGQGGAAALGPNYSVINTATPAGVRLTTGSGPVVNNSDIVQLYVTGLGVPDSAGTNLASQSSILAVPASCVSTTAFLSALNTSAGSNLLSLDGTVIQSALLNNYTVTSNTYYYAPPCMATAVYTATVGGVTAPVTYSGWVADSVAGLYQINVQLPPSASALSNAAGISVASVGTPLAIPTSLPIVITSSTGKSSQIGVTIPVTPKLLVTAPTLLTGTVGVNWCNACSTNLVVASLSPAGSPTYSYALTGGLLPTGLALGGSTGAITGLPAANSSGTYSITVMATDNSPHPLTGTVTFQLNVAGGLYVISSGASPYSATYGSNATLTTVIATGGSYPYIYNITTPSTVPAGITLGFTSGVLAMTNLIPTPSGTYSFQVSATDATLALTGTASFTVNIPLTVTAAAIASSLSAGTGNQTVTTVTALGNTGTLTYTLDSTSLAANFSINAATGVVSSGTAIQGTYNNVQVTATDSTNAPGATGNATKTITLASIAIGA